jgi:hypothetical protein
MNAKLMLAFCLAAAASTEVAHADAVSDRVVLYPFHGGTGCGTGRTAFHRQVEKPDGTSTQETTEFVVPAGKYLEVTSIQYTTPYSTLWAKDYVQSFDLAIRSRTANHSTGVFFARYMNKPHHYRQDDDSFTTGDTFTAHGAETHVASFPVGPLMSSAARLCMTADAKFWTFGGSIRVRGRLIPTGGMVVNPIDGTVSQD